MVKAKKTNQRIKERPIIEAINAAAEEHVGQSKLTRALGSVDFHTREKGMQVLSLWLTRRQNISDGDMLKIWKGVFFCFWHSDKVPVQTELAERLAGIIPQLTEEVALLYFTGFIQIMRREWLNIDRLRLDKFLMLVRFFLHQLFVAFKQRGWDAQAAKSYVQMLQAELLLPPNVKKAAGLALHVADVFLPELLKVAPERPPPSAWLEEVLMPFGCMLEQLDVDMYLQRVRDAVFDPLISELRHPTDGAPLQHLDVAAFAAKLFDLGSQSSTHARNRKALYATSQALERVQNKKAKKEKLNSGIGEEGKQEEADGNLGKKKAKKEKLGTTTDKEGSQVEANGKKKAKKEKLRPTTDDVGTQMEAEENLHTPKKQKSGKGNVRAQAVVDGQEHETQDVLAQSALGGVGDVIDAPTGTASAKKKKTKKKTSASPATGDVSGVGDAPVTPIAGGKGPGANGETSGKKGKGSTKKRKSEQGVTGVGHGDDLGQGGNGIGVEGEDGKGQRVGEEEGEGTFEWIKSMDDWLRMKVETDQRIQKGRKGLMTGKGLAGEGKVGIGGLGVSKKLMKKKKKSALEQVGSDAVLAMLGTQLVSESRNEGNKGKESRAEKPRSSGSDQKVAGAGERETSKEQPTGGVLQETANGAVPGTPTTPANERSKKSGVNAKENGGVTTKQGGKHGRQTKALVRKKKKGVVINLKQNIYFPFGSSPPPPDTRTPPAARPKGSILKKPAGA